MRNSKGFTLIELMTVIAIIAIIGILAAVAIPAITGDDTVHPATQCIGGMLFTNPRYDVDDAEQIVGEGGSGILCDEVDRGSYNDDYNKTWE